MPFTQSAWPVQITTPAGTDKLLVQSFEGEESISGLFFYRVVCASEDPAVDFTQIVGKPVTLKIGLSSGNARYVNGVAGRFSQSGRDRRFTYYVAELRPALWMLTMNADCRIFQNMSVPDIIKKVFSELNFSAFKDSLTATYSPREYCVQYRETAFAFVSRLMEQEGICYFFTHDSSSHTMVLADDASSWAACTDLTAARYGGEPGDWDTDDVITGCSIEQAVTPGQYKADDYSFLTPSTDMLSTASGADTSRSVYDYPGLYGTQSDGDALTSRRLAVLEIDGGRITGTSLCRSFLAGAKFTLSGHYRDDANTSYVIRRLSVQATEMSYSNTFEAFAAAATFRPPLVTPAPFIAGTQTAMVVGKAGEEIWTDQYGRITVQFHWDQLGQKDEKSSCWIRVAQGWAGKAWGSIFLPRVGQEVVVSFLEGNPDRPLITGCVYNAEFTTPYTLPDDQTKSTIKSNSSRGGSGFNELRFEDKAGSEEIFMNAQKDMNVTVLGNETLNVTGTRTMTVTGKEAHTNKADYQSDVTGNFTLKVSGNLSIEASGSVSIKSGTSFDNKAGTALTNNAGTELTNKAGTHLTNDAGVTMTNKAAASQTVDGGGMLTLKGGLVKIN
ncbi:MAG: type VI secretion system tip protein VgrG [Acidobacteriota bacterium]|nr:type VI secretion system tip protein VgrG [Acidobacteriota bacterium]